MRPEAICGVECRIRLEVVRHQETQDRGQVSPVVALCKGRGVHAPSRPNRVPSSENMLTRMDQTASSFVSAAFQDPCSAGRQSHVLAPPFLL